MNCYDEGEDDDREIGHATSSSRNEYRLKATTAAASAAVPKQQSPRHTRSSSDWESRFEKL